jgi:acetolactate decarboxylase
VLDERLITALHVQELRGSTLHAEHEPHVLFQASTIGALLEGAYDGDVSFAQLREHGDLGLGTLNGLDGEMIALDGRFYKADVDGAIDEVDEADRTPFAVTVWFEPTVEFELDEPLENDDFLAKLDERLPTDANSCALRIDGDFDLVHARSVPRQELPYRRFGEVVADQHVFDFHKTSGTLVGFRFPDFAEGLEVSGYHLHFITADRSKGGHVLSCTPVRVRVQVDPSNDLHVELPPGIDLSGSDLAESTREALQQAEHSG